MSNNNRTILWIPAKPYVGESVIGDALRNAFKERGILGEQLFYPTDIPPQGFPSHQRIILDVDLSLGFGFANVAFEEDTVYRGIYNVSQNSLLLSVRLEAVEKYMPQGLAEYFKQCWKRLPPS